MNHGRGTIRVEVLEDAGGASYEMARDVRAGLLVRPKDLSPWPKYFYDAAGSELFEEITALPEYYQTRTERSILEEAAGGIVARTGCRELVELGSGSASKTRTLLDAMLHADGPSANPCGRPNDLVRYAPLDVSARALRESAKNLLEEYPDLEVSGFVGDFEHCLGRALGASHAPGGGRLVVFLGGTIGNFTPEKRRKFLGAVRAGLSPGDHLLIGVDLVKDVETLEAAYNDEAGVTARFNKNLLKVLNERLRGEFDPLLFTHRAVYDAQEARIEMWLCSEVEQTVALADLNLKVRFEPGEGMRTEISAKFTRPEVERMLGEAGYAPTGWYADKGELFALALGRAEDWTRPPASFSIRGPDR